MSATDQSATPVTTAVTSAAAATRPDSKQSVKMEGYLEKRGKMRVVSMWKRYWFVLEGRLLLYYKSQQEYARLSPCRGSLNMGLASCVRPGPAAGPAAADNHVLEVVLRSHVVSLRAKDRTSQELWLKALLDSMASLSTSPGKENGRGPLHFRYPSADNLNSSEQSPSEEQGVASTDRKEKHQTLPNWKKTPLTEPHLDPVPEQGLIADETPEGNTERVSEDLHIAPRKTQGKTNRKNLTRQGSILPILGKKEKTVPNSPRAIHPLKEPEISPFGNQRYSFHGFPKTDEDETNVSNLDPAASMNSKGSNKDSSGKLKVHKNFEMLKKQLSFSSPGSPRELPSLKISEFSQTQEEILKSANGRIVDKEISPSCKNCKRQLSSISEKCHCQNMSTPVREEEKENLASKWKLEKHKIIRNFHSADENQNQLYREPSLERKHSGLDLLSTSGVDLSFLTPDKHEFQKPVRCTSADDLWSPRKNLKASYVKHSKFDYMGSDGQYFSATDICHPSHTLESRMSEPIGSERKKLVKLSLRQRLIHGNGEYIKYSEPEDCDKRDSTLNTTSDSHLQAMKIKPKIRIRKRKGSTAKDSYTVAGSCENGHKKRAPVRSFLSRVLSHVRRSKSEDIMDHPDNNGMYSDDAFLSPHPDMKAKCYSTPASQLLEEVKKIDNDCIGSEPLLKANFQLGLPNAEFGEAPEEPPPDYDSVGVEPVIDTARSSALDEPPQLPPRRMKRPRSPWHDVPTNNSPVIDMDNEARLRMLSAAKYGKVIGTRTSPSLDLYDWGDSHRSDHSQHHAYEIVSDGTSPAGSNEHLAIYLSSESSDDEFHEEVVLRRNIKDCEFLYGIDNRIKNPFGNIRSLSAMEPLSITTDTLPTLDSSGRVGLSHVEAMKLSLLMQAQKTSTDSVRRLKDENDIKRLKEELGKIETNQENMENTACEADTQVPMIHKSSDECLQQPPEEFADKKDCKSSYLMETAEQVMEEVKGILSPVESLLNSCCDSSENTKREEEQSTKSSIIEIAEVRKTNPSLSTEALDVPPQLPSKKSKAAWKTAGIESCNRHSDELNDLLVQLASMTTAPLLPVGATCSLQMSTLDPNRDLVGSVHCSSVRKQSLSLNAVACKYDAEPDYDIPRPHASLFQNLQQNSRQYPSSCQDDDGIVVEATHFFSRPESPRNGIAEDQNWCGHMSPDSLDFPFTPRRALNWDLYDSRSVIDRVDTHHKSRSKKDRSRRATLNGPITQLPSESPVMQAPLVRRNSVEFSPVETKVKLLSGTKNQKERGSHEPKQLSSCQSAICSHNSSPYSSLDQNCFNLEGNTCKNFQLSSSLEDISEKSELNSDSSCYKPEENRQNVKKLTRYDELDMDSLEASEIKRIDMPEILVTASLVSIVEEPDLLSDRSDCLAEPVNTASSGSASDGAVMTGGDSNNSATDMQTNHSTDTDMEMLSDDDSGLAKDVKINDDLDGIGRVIEPDSLLHESLVHEKNEHQLGIVDFDSTKDVSLEADSLELRK